MILLKEGERFILMTEKVKSTFLIKYKEHVLDLDCTTKSNIEFTLNEDMLVPAEFMECLHKLP